MAVPRPVFSSALTLLVSLRKFVSAWFGSDRVGSAGWLLLMSACLAAGQVSGGVATPGPNRTPVTRSAGATSIAVNAPTNLRVESVDQGSVCGPPGYLCSRSDTEMIVPASPPQLGANPKYFGGHLGAGMVAIDPAYKNRILRVTDSNTDPSHPGRSFNTSSSAEQNVTSYDEALFLAHDEGNRLCLFGFDANTFKTTPGGCFASVAGDGAKFGYTEADNRAIYTYNGSVLRRLVVSATNWTITSDPGFNAGLGYFDPDAANCLNGQIAANHWYVHNQALSSDDNTMIASFGPEQDEDPYIVVWNAAKGCQWLNVHTWQVSQGWNTGLKNPTNITWASGAGPALPGGVHNVQVDRSGTYGILTINGTTLGQKVFWTLGTSIVNDGCTQCTSHWACDYGSCLWNYQHQTTYDLRSLVIPGTSWNASSNSLTVFWQPAVSVMDTTPALGHWRDDEHASHANAAPGLKNIYLVSWQPDGGGGTVTEVWDDEITGVNWDGTKRTIRFNKSWNSGYGGFWGSARCQISRQGHYSVCGSDYQMYNLDKGFGNGLSQDTCDHTEQAGTVGTTACRTDVLLFELR
jgi:hypothetical protein